MINLVLIQIRYHKSAKQKAAFVVKNNYLNLVIFKP